MSYFDNQEEMLIPLSIDSAETEKTNYFTSNGKVLKMFFAMLPYPIMLSFFVKQSAGFGFLVMLTVIYLIAYFYFLRLFIVEEFKFKKQLSDMEENKKSNINYFYGISSIEDIDGLGKIKYRKRSGEKLRHGFVVSYDTGSLVNVPQGNNWRYLKSKQEFIKRLHRARFDFRWYELQTRVEMPQVLTDYANMLSFEDNEEAQMVVKMNLNVATACVMDSEQTYKNYIIVTNTNFSNLQNFGDTLNDIIRNTLGANGYIRNPEILSKEDVEKFFETYLMQRNIDFESANQMNEFKKFSKYANIVRVLDADGNIIPTMLLEKELNEDNRGNKSFQDIEEERKYKEQEYEKQRLARLNKEIEKLLKERNNNRIDDLDYKKERIALEERYSKENYPKLFGEKGRFIGKTPEERESLNQARNRERELRDKKARERRESRNKKKGKNTSKNSARRQSDNKNTVNTRKYDTIGIVERDGKTVRKTPNFNKLQRTGQTDEKSLSSNKRTKTSNTNKSISKNEVTKNDNNKFSVNKNNKQVRRKNNKSNVVKESDTHTDKISKTTNIRRKNSLDVKKPMKKITKPVKKVDRKRVDFGKKED